MLEREMENLIASFPEDFFPGHQLVLKGRQQSFAGIGRFDLLFTDRHQSNVLMELKAVPAKYQNADQLGQYKTALELQNERNILMWLVAPLIPTSVRELLDRIGIEYTEIHENQFRRIADRRGIAPNVANSSTFSTAKPQDFLPNSPALNHELCESDYALLPSIDKQLVSHLIKQFELAVKRDIDKSLAIKLRTEILAADKPGMKHETMLQLARWCKTDGIYSDGMMIAQKISEILFGSILDRQKLKT